MTELIDCPLKDLPKKGYFFQTLSEAEKLGKPVYLVKHIYPKPYTEYFVEAE